MYLSRNISAASFLICVILAITIKLIRDDYFGHNKLLDIFLGSSPTFLYVFGIIVVVPLFKSTLTMATYKKIAFALAAGALAYEFEQIWTTRVFDFYDVGSIILALILFYGIKDYLIEKDDNT